MATLNEMIAQGAQFYTPDPVAQYNKLAQMQQYKTQNELSQQEAIDKATERQRIVSDRARRSTFLTGLSQKLAEKGHTLDRDTLSSMMSSGIPDIEKLAFEGFKALNAEESFNAAMGGAPARAAAPAPAPAPTAQAAALSPTVQTSIDDMVSRGIPREAITTGPEGQVYVGSYGSNVVGEPIMEQYRTPEGSLATRPQAPLTPLRVAANQMALGSVNTMVPQAPAPAANAMIAPAPAAPPQTQLQSFVDQYERLSKIPNPDKRVDNRIKFLTEEISRLSKRNLHTVAGVGLVDADTNKIVYASQEKGTLLSQFQAELAAATDPKVRREIQARIDKETSHPLPTKVDTKVNAYVPASETAQTQFMQEARVTYSALKNAQPTLDNIEAAKALVPTAKGFMGAGGEPLLAAASFLNNRLGTKIDTQGVTDANVLRSRLFFGILDNLKKLDSQPSQSQQAAMQEALGNLGTDPNALGRVLDAFADSIRTKVDLHNAEMSDAETRGVKFPYNPRIVIKPRSGATSNPHAGKTNEQIKKELGL